MTFTKKNCNSERPKVEPLQRLCGEVVDEFTPNVTQVTSSDERVLVCEVSWIVTRDFETGDRVVVVAVTLRQGRGREGVDGFTPNVTELTSSESPCLCTISSNEHPSVSFSSLFRRRNKSFKLGISLTYLSISYHGFTAFHFGA